MLRRGSAKGNEKRTEFLSGHTYLLPTVLSAPVFPIPHYFAQDEKATNPLPKVGQFVIQNTYAEPKS
jgi:hypothetical protein